MERFEHGGDIYSRHITHDFSANINPLGMPQSAKKALIDNVECFERYPDCRCRELTAAIRGFENLNIKKNVGTASGIVDGWIVCGNGAADLIYRIVSVLRPRRALLPVPSFLEYEKALQTVGCEIRYHILKQESDFRLMEDVIGEITEDVDILFLCNPNNPVGNGIAASLMERILHRCRECGVTVVVDECFLEFVEEKRKKSVVGNLAAFPNLLVLKAFTKIFAMAGLRLGYMLCANEALCERIRDYGQCWSVSVPAQVAGLAAMREEGFLERTRQYVKRERQFLRDGLQDLDCKVYESEANFLFFYSPCRFDQLLLPQGIAIRSCENYRGLEYGYFRIAVRTHEENEYLIHMMKKI